MQIAVYSRHVYLYLSILVICRVAGLASHMPSIPIFSPTLDLSICFCSIVFFLSPVMFYLYLVHYSRNLCTSITLFYNLSSKGIWTCLLTTRYSSVCHACEAQNGRNSCPRLLKFWLTINYAAVMELCPIPWLEVSQDTNIHKNAPNIYPEIPVFPLKIPPKISKYPKHFLKISKYPKISKNLSFSYNFFLVEA